MEPVSVQRCPECMGREPGQPGDWRSSYSPNNCRSRGCAPAYPPVRRLRAISGNDVPPFEVKKLNGRPSGAPKCRWSSSRRSSHPTRAACCEERLAAPDGQIIDVAELQHLWQSKVDKARSSCACWIASAYPSWSHNSQPGDVGVIH